MFVHVEKILLQQLSNITINKYLCLHFNEMYDLSLSTQDITQSQEYTSFLVFVIKLEDSDLEKVVFNSSWYNLSMEL